MTNKKIVILSAGVILVVVVIFTYSWRISKNDLSSAPISTGQPQEQLAAAAAEENQIKIQNFAFSPAMLKIQAGTKVTWTNENSIGHTITTDGDDKTLNSPLLGQGESFSFIFTQPGTFAYHCTPHPNMKAEIVVE